MWRLVAPSRPPAWFVFFKQKTAYEIHERLVGSEMCIRDSIDGAEGARFMAELNQVLSNIMEMLVWVKLDF